MLEFFSPIFPLREKQPRHDQKRSDPGHHRDLLVQNHRGSHHRDHRNRVDIITGLHSPQHLHRKILRHKAGRGRTKPQEYNIKKIQRIHKPPQVQMESEKNSAGIINRIP